VTKRRGLLSVQRFDARWTAWLSCCSSQQQIADSTAVGTSWSSREPYVGASAAADEHDPAAVDADSDTADEEAAALLARSGCAFFSVREAGAGAGAADDDDDDDEEGVEVAVPR